MKRNLLLFLFLLCFSLSCRKEQKAGAPLPGETAAGGPGDLKLEEVRNWYNTNQSTSTGQTQSTATGNLPQFSLARLKPDWKKAQSFNNTTGNYWLISLSGQPEFNNVKQGYRKLAFLKDSSGKLQARILEIIPDALYFQRRRTITTADFAGRIFIYDQEYHLLGGKVFANGKMTGEINPAAGPSANNQHINSLHTNLAQVETCEWYDSYYIDAENVATIYSEKICSVSYYGNFPDMGGGLGGGFDAGTGDYAGGGGNNGSTPAPPPEISNLPGESNPAINPKQYMDCFGSIPDAGATMKITVYVQEPGT